jgi:imidazolonepropionase-like amidohydrolase
MIKSYEQDSRQQLEVVIYLLFSLSSCGFIEDVNEIVTVESISEGVVFKDASLFTAMGPDLQSHMDIVVLDGKIKSISPTGGELPPNAMVIDASGKTLIPGLVDAHVHLIGTAAAPWDLHIVPPESLLQSWLASGVTTVYDMGGDPGQLFDIRQALSDNKIIGPRIFIPGSSPVTATEAHPIPALRALMPKILEWPLISQFPTVDGPEDAYDVVQESLSYKPDHFKIIYDSIPDDSPHMTKETLVALVNSAHAENLPVFVHIGTPDDALQAIEAGVDVLAHGIYQGELSEEDALVIAESQIPIVYTAWAFEASAQVGEGRLESIPLDQLVTPERTMREAIGPAGMKILKTEVLSDMTNTCIEWRDVRRANIKRLSEAGARIVVGTDSPFFGIWPGSSIHREMEELVISGHPPAEVLLGATSYAAHLYDQDPEYGTIAPGKRADLLLIEGNPIADIRSTRKISIVMQGGNIIKTKALPK